MAAPRRKSDYVNRIAEKCSVPAQELEKHDVNRLKEIWTSIKPRPHARVLPPNWKRGSLDSLRDIYVEVVAPALGRSVEDKHYHGWKKSQFILELDLFQSDQEAVEEEEVVPESPMCVMCQLPMTKRTNRLTRQDFWGCLRFPLCRETLSLTYYQMPTEKIQPLMTEAQPSVSKKRSQVPIAPSNASWGTVGTPLEEDHAAAGSARFNMNVTKEEMEVLLRKREEDAVKCEVPK